MHPSNQQQLATKNIRHYIEDALAILGMAQRSWRLIAVTVALCLTVSVIYVFRGKTVYNASARLLVLQQSGRSLGVAGGDPFQHLQNQDSLATHILIIRSPAIVERAIASSGMDGLSLGSVIDRLTVKQPTEGAKILELAYRADASNEALAVMKGVITSYDQFLRENYQKDTRDVISLIIKARDDLSRELKQLEQEYLEFRQNSPTFVSDKEGRTFLSRRIDQWDQASNQAMARAMQLKSQLELAKKLAGEGAAHNFITAAINQLSGTGMPVILPEDGSSGDGVGASYERTLALMAEVRLQRRGKERLLQQIGEELVAASVGQPSDDPAIVREFYADPAVADLKTRLHEEQRKRGMTAGFTRDGNDPSLQRSDERIESMKTRLGALWQQMGPQLLAVKRDPGQIESVRRLEEELIILRAREATLNEHLLEAKAERIGKLTAERKVLAQLESPPAAKLADLDRQIDKLTAGDDTPAVVQGDRRNSNLIGTLERSAEAIDTMRNQIQKLFDEDLDASKQAEIAQLAEANLRSNLDRQRVLFDSVASQLKQAQLASDFGSVTAQTINPPSIAPVRPRSASILFLGLVAGCGLGGGLAYLVDLMEARIRTITELKSALNLPLIAMVPKLSAVAIAEASHVALLSHQSPRSYLAESYKTARTNIEFLRRNRQAQVILVSSPVSGDGKSTTSSNLAITLALAGRKILLIDGDLRKPCLHSIYGLTCDHGLTSVLQGEDRFARAVRPTAIENLDLLVAGPEVSNPAELLASDLLAALLEEVRPIYDVIIFDTSPFLAVTDPWIISAVADGILLVVRLGSTRKHDIEQTLDVLKTLDAPILGMIANGVVQDNYSYCYGYTPNRGQPQPAPRPSNNEPPTHRSLALEVENGEDYPRGHRNGSARSG